ncbi:MAG: phosphoribosylanthranilate isomerase, partial [Gammaproteobacteria bacterium]
MFIKICGLTTPDATRSAVAAGADAIGFVFAESPRRVSPERAMELCADVPDSVVRVAVMRHPSVAEWEAVRDGFAPDWLQTDADDLAQLEIPSNCQPLPVYRTGRITADQASGRLLYEGVESGRSELADWSEAA